MKTIRDAVQTAIEPVTYKGKLIQLYDRTHFKKGDTLHIRIISTNSPHKQGIAFRVIDPKDKKYLLMNDETYGGMTLWEQKFPKNGIDIVIEKDCKVAIWNAWEEEEPHRKQVWSALKNAAMHIKVSGNKRIYYCNDGDDDEDFDDLVFSIEIKKP